MQLTTQLENIRTHHIICSYHWNDLDGRQCVQIVIRVIELSILHKQSDKMVHDLFSTKSLTGTQSIIYLLS
jgi:hypothetical protein